MIAKQVLLLALLCFWAQGQGSIQITPISSQLFSSTAYLVSHFSTTILPTTTTYLLDFSSSYIVVPNATLNVTTRVGTTQVSGANGTCSNGKCTLRLNNVVPAFTNIQFTIGNLQNPPFLFSQNVNTKVTSTTFNESSIWTIQSSYYSPMPITLNSMKQSNYGVGNTDVSYTFNFSISMTPANPQLSIVIPSQIQVGKISSALSFYGNIQNINHVFTNNIMIFNLVTPAANSTDPNGFVLLTISGLTNPQSMGNSSSFTIQLLTMTFPGTTTSCTNCIVSQINSGLVAQSTVPGNILTLSFGSTNTEIGQTTDITVYSQLFASVPLGGMYQIILPSSVKPVLPITCYNIYGFTLSIDAPPSCSYNSTTNSIFTNNFVFSSIGNVVVQVTIINPPDTRKVSFWFQTFDSAGNMIGNSTLPYVLTATPLLLSASSQKTNSQVETSYRLNVNLTLGIALVTGDQLQVVLPQANYKPASITCSSSGVNIPCTTSTDVASGNMTISMSPPCSQCSKGSNLTFSIDGLTNPSFINAYTQTVIIQTSHPQGVVESNALTLTLTPATLTVANYLRSGGNSIVGSSYDLSFTYSIPSYASTNGGQLILTFIDGDSYSNIVYDPTSSSYTYPTSLTVLDSQGNSYSNNIVFYSTGSPQSIQQIIIQICGSNSCGGSITIKGLRKSFSLLTSIPQTLQITTLLGDEIASTVISAMNFASTRATKSLGLVVGNSVATLNSTYQLEFVSNGVPFQPSITFTLSQGNIRGGCFATHNASIFKGIFNCQVSNSTTISLTYNGDSALMMLETITYSVTITNVVNPSSLVPLVYSMSTTFNGGVNQLYSVTYSIQTALPLTFSYTRTNSTFGQTTQLTLTITSTYPTFDEIKLAIPADLMTVQSNTLYNSAMMNNNYQISHIYQITSNSVVLSVINPTSTSTTGNITFSMYIAGYLSATGLILIAPIQPVYLGMSATVSNRTVGATSQLTVNLNRVNPYNSESSFVLNFNSGLFDFSNATYNGNALTLPITVPIGVTSLTIMNLRNILYIPVSTPSNSTLTAWTIDGNGFKVSLSAFTVENLLPNSPSTGLTYSFTRSNTAINGIGAITITYTPRFPTSVGIMTINLPVNQSVLVSYSCSIVGGSSGSTNCVILSSTGSSVTLQFTNQTTTTLNNVRNLEPNSSPLQLALYTTNNELVQTSSAMVTPSIQYNQLAVSGTITSSTVATNAQLKLTISSPNSIDVGSKIVMNLPDKTFTKISLLTTQECSYIVSGSTYNGCQYGMNGNWVSQVNLTYLGPTTVPANSVISITLPLTNAWTSTLFNSKALTLYINSPADNFVAQGMLSLLTLYAGINSLNVSPVNLYTITQSTPTAASPNTLTVKFSLPVPIPFLTTIQMAIPKNTYTISNLNSASLSNLQISTTSQNSTHYQLVLNAGCTFTSGAVCNLADTQYSFTVGVVNNLYVLKASTDLSVYIQLGSELVSAQASTSAPTYAPQTISTTLSRSNRNAYQPTIATLSFANPSISTFSLIIFPQTTPSGTSALLGSLTSVGLSASQTLTYSQNSTNHIIVTVNGLTGTTTSILFSGINNLLIGQTPEKYAITLLDSNYVYFTGSITPSDTILPYSTGLTLQRTITTVGSVTNLYLSGQLPIVLPSMNVVFNGVNYPVSGQTFNISLGNTTNSNNVSDASTASITIRNSDYLAFSASLPFTPSLTAQSLTSLISFSVPTSMNVSQNISASLTFSNASFSYLSVKLPQFYKKINYCCIDASCSQTNILSCTTSTSVDRAIIELTLKTNQIISNVTFGLSALDYQINFKNSPVSIAAALPSATLELNCSVSVNTVELTSTLLLENKIVGRNNTYTLGITPINRIGYLRITLPTFVFNQLTAPSATASYFLSLNGTTTPASLTTSSTGKNYITIPVTSSSMSTVLLLKTIVNPINNEPFQFLVEQAQDQQFLYIYGMTRHPTEMNVFDPLTLSSAVRSVTKIGSNTQVALQITAPSYTDQMTIVFPISQLVTGSSCSITAEGQTLPCTVLSSNSIMTTNLQGSGKYLITGLVNQKSFDATTANDLVSITIGSPYTRASTTGVTTTYIDPQLTLGTISLLKSTTSNPVLLSSTTLTYEITVENTQNIDGFIFEYADYYYILSENVKATINGVEVKSQPLSSVKIFLPVKTIPQQLTITLANVINYIKPAKWSIRSVQTSTKNNVVTYSDVDLYYADGTGLTAMGSSNLPLRIILPKNYVQDTPASVLLLLDVTYPAALPTTSLSVNLSSSGAACSMTASPFAKTLSFTCPLTQIGILKIQATLYHTLFASTPLSLGSVSVPILKTPTGGCNNQMCDSCSVYNGQEYCFSCREGLFASDGKCQQKCNQGTFPYQSTGICQKCYPTCATCFGLYEQECLSCADGGKVLDSGSCRQTCAAGTYSYDSYCIKNPECEGIQGCRLCSSSGFCYQCLPDYKGAPTCTYSSSMPATIMIYILAPFLLLAVASVLIVAIQCKGADTILSQTVFSFSFVEVIGWGLTVPVAKDIPTAMVLLSFLALRIIISIVSYEVFYKKSLGELSQKLIEEQSQKDVDSRDKPNEQAEKTTDVNNWKTKLVRLVAHFNGPDSYELLKSRIAPPVLSVSHNFPIQTLFMVNRWLVVFIMIYILSTATVGDSILMPVIMITTAGLISFLRLLTWDKVRNCLNRCRS